MRLWRAASLSRVERRELLRAQLALLGAQVRVWTRPRGALVAEGKASYRAAPSAAQLRDARAIAYGVSRVARSGLFRPSCLVRTLALSRLLERAGIPGARVRIGVRAREGHFEAHAWLELAGVVLGDSPHRVATFSHLTDVRPAGVP